MTYSDTAICNIALGLIGVGRIADINGTSPVERDCRTIFSYAREEVLGGYHWSFARKQQRLSQLATPPEITSENGGYDYAYALPTDCIAPVRLSDKSTPFEVSGDTLICNLETDVLLYYTADITDAAKFTAKFVNALAHRLAAQLAMMIKKDKKLSQEGWDLYYSLLPSLEGDDSMNDNMEVPVSNPYVDARSV